MKSLPINSNSFCVLLLGLLCFHNFICTMHFNDKPLSTLLKQDECLIFTPLKINAKDNIVVLEIKNRNFSIKTGNLSDTTNNFEKSLLNLKSQKKQFGSIKTKKTTIIASSTICIESHYLKGSEYLNLQGLTSIYCAHSLIKSPRISCVSNEMQFINSYLLYPYRLSLRTATQESDCEIIRITFNRAPINPTIIDGIINFANNETPSKLILTNVKKFRIQFNPNAWKESK